MSSNRFVISDTHFGHENILGFTPPRVFDSIVEHDTALIDRWNSKVTNNDIVYHLGDFALQGGKKRIPEIIHKLKFGTLHVILGNHDNLRNWEGIDRRIKFHGSLEFKGKYIMTHLPVSDQQKVRFERNLHGHLHHDILPDPWYINCAVDHHDYYPMKLEELLDVGS